MQGDRIQHAYKWRDAQSIRMFESVCQPLRSNGIGVVTNMFCFVGLSVSKRGMICMSPRSLQAKQPRQQETIVVSGHFRDVRRPHKCVILIEPAIKNLGMLYNFSLAIGDNPCRSSSPQHLQTYQFTPSPSAIFLANV